MSFSFISYISSISQNITKKLLGKNVRNFSKVEFFCFFILFCEFGVKNVTGTPIYNYFCITFMTSLSQTIQQ